MQTFCSVSDWAQGEAPASILAILYPNKDAEDLPLTGIVKAPAGGEAAVEGILATGKL